MLLIDKLNYVGCAGPVETSQRAKTEGVAQCANYTPLRHPWLSSLWNNSLSLWSQLPVEKLARKRALLGLFPALSKKIHSQLFFYFPKVGEIKANCIVIFIISYIVMQESRKEKQTDKEIETIKQRQRKWKKHDIRKAVGKSKGENTGFSSQWFFSFLFLQSDGSLL